MNDLFINEIRLERERIPNFDTYPFNIPVIRNLTSIPFYKPITYLVGENGAGKSTLIEALAVNMGLSAEGGTRNMVYESFNTTSELYQYLKVIKSGQLPKWKFFLRAESFYTMANNYETYRGASWHEMSHGEAFLKILGDLSEGGLYFMDEPESALSPKNQMCLLAIMHRHAQYGSQFIISTHSPILLSYINAEIKNVDNGLLPIKYQDTQIYQLYRRFLDCPEKMQRFLFDS
jgi:predicted ATPase